MLCVVLFGAVTRGIETIIHMYSGSVERLMKDTRGVWKRGEHEIDECCQPLSFPYLQTHRRKEEWTGDGRV